MAKIIFRENPLSNKVHSHITFDKDVNARELINFLKLDAHPLFCKVNGDVPELIDDDFIFKGKDVVEISLLLEGGGGDGGGKSTLATVLTVVVAAAAIAVSGGALAGVGLAAGSVGAAVAGAAIGIGGNLLIGSLFPADVQGNAVGGSETLPQQLVDTSIGNSRNANPFGGPVCLPLGNCCRIAPPFGSQPYSTLVPYLNEVTRTQQVWQVNDTGEPCAQVCYRYRTDWADRIEEASSAASDSTPFASGNGVFTGPEPARGDAAAYPFEICFMSASPEAVGGFANGVNQPYFGKTLDENGLVYSRVDRSSGTAINAVTCDQGDELISNGIAGEWYNLGLSGITLPGGTSIPIVVNDSFNIRPMGTLSCIQNKTAGNPTGIGLGGFNGFRHKPFVFLCDPNDPNFGQFVSLEFGNAFGWDPAAMAAEPFSDDKIDGNPQLDPLTGEVIEAGPFCIADAEFCVNEEITEDKMTNRVHQIFNYGYGDLKISDSQFGSASTDTLQEIEENFNETNSLDWPMPEDSCAHERVDVVEGGLLPNNDLASGPDEQVGFDDFDQLNWVERCGPEKTEEIVVEIFANLYQTSATRGIVAHSEEIQIQYRPFNSNQNWLPLGNATGLHTLTGYDTFPVREDFTSGVVDCDKYCVRVRRLTQEDRDPSITDNINLTSIKFFQKDCKAFSKDGEIIPTNYKGQNRVAVCVSAGTSQSGVLDRYNAKVSNRVWMFDIDEYKETGVKNWVWDCEAGDTRSNNPAFQFLYFLRGGYCNSSADPVANPSINPIDGGFTTFGVHNGEHPDNEELLWGGGVSEKRIDLECICEWACFNHENEFCLIFIYVKIGLLAIF